VTDEAKGNTVRHSVTALKQFEFCERQFYYQRILGLPERPGPQLAVGIAYHAAIERMVREPDRYVEECATAGVEQAQTEKGWCDPGLPEGELIKEITGALTRLSYIRKVLLPLVRDGKPLIEVWCEKFTGKVNFSEDEANGKKSDDE
jgi:ATP-dependent helicase/DNAse subunit B